MTDRELVITRAFDAPRELVWNVWSDPLHLAKWWGPKDFTTPVCMIDFRVGGKYLYCMRSPEGRDCWNTGIYEEIVEPDRFSCTDSFADEEGNIVPASYYGMDGDWPLALHLTVIFEESEGGTKLTLRHTGIPAGQMSELTDAGWNESLDKMAEVLRAFKPQAARP